MINFKYNLYLGYCNLNRGYFMGLLQALSKSENARKVFGKRELKIIEKQLLGVSLTQSEKNRLSRDIRKKFEFIDEISRFKDDFKLKKGSDVKKIIGLVEEVILESRYFPRIKRIILFGSSVDKQRTLRSDIDLAVEFKHIEQNEAVRFRLDMLRKVSDMVDIQVYNFLPNKIKKEIELKGKVLYEKKN